MGKATVDTFLKAMKEMGWKYEDRGLWPGDYHSFRFWDGKRRRTAVWLEYSLHSVPRICVNPRKHSYKVEYPLGELELVTFDEKDAVMLCLGDKPESPVLFHFYNYTKKKAEPPKEKP